MIFNFLEVRKKKINKLIEIIKIINNNLILFGKRKVVIFEVIVIIKDR